MLPRDLGCGMEGKEFDVVVIVEGFRGVALLKEDEAPKFENSRRVLRFGSPEHGMQSASFARPMPSRSSIRSYCAVVVVLVLH